MADYIDRKTALSFPFANEQYDHENANEDFILGCESYKEWLESLPVADVQEVKHGKWLDCGSIWDGVDEYRMWRCSECIVPNYKNSRYCPNCGAKMDGKETE